MATLPSNSATVRRNASPMSSPVDWAWRPSTTGMTLASVVIGASIDRSWAIFRSAWLSTSPLSTATAYVRCGRPAASSLLTGWQFGSLMIPTLAQRV